MTFLGQSKGPPLSGVEKSKSFAIWTFDNEIVVMPALLFVVKGLTTKTRAGMTSFRWGGLLTFRGFRVPPGSFWEFRENFGRSNPKRFKCVLKGFGALITWCGHIHTAGGSTGWWLISLTCWNCTTMTGVPGRVGCGNTMIFQVSSTDHEP